MTTGVGATGGPEVITLGAAAAGDSEAWTAVVPAVVGLRAATSAYDRWTEGEPSSSDPLSERQMRASEPGDPWLRGEPGEEGEGGAASAIVAARPAAD